MVIDSSSLISLSRAGLLPLLDLLPAPPVVADVVERETVEAGLAGGYADAAAIAHAIQQLPRRKSSRQAQPDAAVIELAMKEGTLVCNDLTLGRRARNLGLNWLRTADLIVFLVRSALLQVESGRQSIAALRDAGLITDDLAGEYLAELR